MRGTAHISALEREFVAEACDKFRSQSPKPPFLNQESKTALGAGLTRAVVAINLDQLDHDCGRLEDFDEDIQRRGYCESYRAHLAAHQNVEAEPASLLGGNEGDILRFAVCTVVRATRYHDVELAGQVGELRIALAAHDDAVQFVDDRRGVEQFVRRQTGEGTTVDVANVVDAGLQRAQVHASQLFPDFRHSVESEAAQLDLLPCGDVQDAVAKAPRELGDGAELFALRKTVGHANAHHEFAGRGLAEEYADPLQQFFFCRRERLGAALDDLWNVIQNAQAVAVHRGFVAFDGVVANGNLCGSGAFHRVGSGL